MYSVFQSFCSPISLWDASDCYWHHWPRSNKSWHSRSATRLSASSAVWHCMCFVIDWHVDWTPYNIHVTIWSFWQSTDQCENVKRKKGYNVLLIGWPNYRHPISGGNIDRFSSGYASIDASVQEQNLRIQFLSILYMFGWKLTFSKGCCFGELIK